ncbi:hypothetical protein OS493_030009 [Desmophyllum pertusum]|uniref:Uncharacterized protein n=1 Tax=Desmophyllum pertusum TaxID=174260 RepID=A0A9W9ZK54_9CNID|nr:hypothetical protein OS493_030009 [Desmophyllum pertusum]
MALSSINRSSPFFTDHVCLLPSTLWHFSAWNIGWFWGKGYTESWGFNRYTKYEAGDNNTNIIITAPHGGNLNPSNRVMVKVGQIESRTAVKESIVNVVSGCTVVAQPVEIAKPEYRMIYTLGENWIANRDIEEATFHVPDAIKAYQDYNKFISQARSAITGRGLLLDIHGQAHKPERTELATFISRLNLNKGVYSMEQTSIRNLGKHWCGSDNACFKDFIHGNRSLGYFMNQHGLQAVPSPQNKKQTGHSISLEDTRQRNTDQEMEEILMLFRWNSLKHFAKDGEQIPKIGWLEPSLVL